jgi:hypothetical protein
MQALRLKRFAIHRIGVAAAAIGTLAIGLTGVNTIQDAVTGSDVGAAAVILSTHDTDPAQTMRFLEWNTQIPAAVAPQAPSEAEMRFIEWNTQLPSQTITRTTNEAEMRFLELNMFLPGMVVQPAVPSYDEMRFLEWNSSLPASDAPYYPSPDQMPATSADTNY